MLNFLSSYNTLIYHRGQSGGRGPSPRLWTNEYGQAGAPDGQAIGYTFGDDFTNFGTIATGISGATAGVNNGYAWYTDTATSACYIQNIVADGGVIRIGTGATDNHEAWLSQGGTTGASYRVKTNANGGKLLIYETRFRLGQVGNTYGAFFGLAEEGLAAANTITDAGALADKDFLGFFVSESDGDTLNFVHRKAGQTVQSSALITDGLVANTWYKAGFIFNPRPRGSTNRVVIYINNAEQTVGLTEANISAATFPADQGLTCLFGIKNGTASANTIDFDWFDTWQEA